MSAGAPVIYDAHNRPIPLSTLRKRSRGQVKALLSGFKGANDQNLADWVTLPLDISTILRNDLQKLRVRSRDLARNDDTAKRFLSLLKQNVLGHRGVILQAKNKLTGASDLDEIWNGEIEREWASFGKRRRRRGQFEAPSSCGQMNLREIAWLTLLSRAVDGECFLQIFHGYPHNGHRFAVRFLNPDLLESSYCTELSNGNRVEMGIEFDEFDRPVAYHFSEQHPNKKYTGSNRRRKRVPASQIIHIFRHEYVGQLRGIPDFTAIMHKAKMLNGVHEALVVGWRVAASKMGFFTASDPELAFGNDDDDEDTVERFKFNSLDATPGSFEVIPQGLDLNTFDPDYPSSTYESGHKVFMQQLSNGLNVSSPTLSNNYEGVNYSSLRQALLEDREGWRCVQAEMIDGFYQPLFDEWYDWTVDVTRRIDVPPAKRHIEPTIIWQPRGWAWVDPYKEGQANALAIESNLKTRQAIIAETSGADFLETADALAEEKRILQERDLYSTAAGESVTTDNDKDNDDE